MLLFLKSLAMSQVQEMGGYGVNLYGISRVTTAMKVIALSFRNFQMKRVLWSNSIQDPVIHYLWMYNAWGVDSALFKVGGNQMMSWICRNLI